jgi:hypothetical protein
MSPQLEAPAMSTVHVFGIRHHGPGSARAVLRGLEELRPDAVLIEGPPELDVVAALAADPDMHPPVAGLVYSPEEPKRASFYPMADFSPEWVALRWALAHDTPVRFADLPAATMLADQPDAEPPDPHAPPPAPRIEDPIGVLARTAGFDDPERWWEDAVEHRRDHTERTALDAFDAVREAMAALRDDSRFVGNDRLDNARREASMRQAIRQTTKEHDTVVFVCGAWHAPAIHPDAHPSIKHDADLLKGLPKVKVAATWVPWTNRRLAFRSGYGAGITSPGWYQHLFTAPGDVTTRWLTRTASSAPRTSTPPPRRSSKASAWPTPSPPSGADPSPASPSSPTPPRPSSPPARPCPSSSWPSASTSATPSAPSPARRRWCRSLATSSVSRSA